MPETTIANPELETTVLVDGAAPVDDALPVEDTVLALTLTITIFIILIIAITSVIVVTIKDDMQDIKRDMGSG